MRALLNVPLVFLALALARLFAVTVLMRSNGGNDATMGTAYEILFETSIVWLNVAIVLGVSGAMGGIRWLDARGFAGFMVGMMAFGGMLLLAFQSIGIAIEPQAARHWPFDQVVLARLVAFGLPLMVLSYGGWIVNAPQSSRAAPSVRLGVFGATGVLCLIAAVVSVREMAREGEVAQTRAVAERAAQQQVADVAAEERRRAFAALTDERSLDEWSMYTWNVPDDVKAEALRRIALRPALEAELTEMLGAHAPETVLAGMDLIVAVPFTPSPALDRPVREAVLAFAARLARELKEITYDGDKRIDYYRIDDPRGVLPVTERMAQASGADLRNAIDAVARAVALFPKSEQARSFPGRAEAVKQRIGAVLAGRGR